MTIAVHAVGAAVYLIDAHAAAGGGAAGAEAPGAQEAAAPGTSIPMAGAAESGSAGNAEGAAAGQSWDSADSAGGARNKAGLLRMLALYLDCGVDMEMQVCSCFLTDMLSPWPGSGCNEMPGSWFCGHHGGHHQNWLSKLLPDRLCHSTGMAPLACYMRQATHHYSTKLNSAASHIDNV